jgi:mono/diheme cytochrome c family protein
MIEKYVEAEDFRRLLSTLGAVLCFLVIAGLFASIVVPGLRNANKPQVPTAVSPVVGESGWLDPTEFPPKKRTVILPVDPKTLLKRSDELMKYGKDLFEKDCIQCHGTLGRGDGAAAAGMTPPPRNFTSPAGWKNGYDLPGIFKTLSEGIQGTSMAPFDYLLRKERMELAHYVQSLGALHNTASPQAMEALSKELASAGETTPNTIPVSMAMTKLEQEFAAPQPLAMSGGDQGAEILRQVVINGSRAAQVLTESQAWRATPSDLAAAILPDAPENGFSVGTAKLSPSEWKILHAALLKRAVLLKHAALLKRNALPKRIKPR